MLLADSGLAAGSILEQREAMAAMAMGSSWALVPMASQPTPMASRNWMLRRLVSARPEGSPWVRTRKLGKGSGALKQE